MSKLRRPLWEIYIAHPKADGEPPAGASVYVPELVRRLLAFTTFAIANIVSDSSTILGERRAVTPAGTARVRRPEEWFSLRG
jgi:hypothetical protein